MKKFDIKTTITVYNSPQELPEKYQILLQAAKAGLKKSYSPYSNFKVSAAILLENGEILTGANQENAAYTMCLCAERVVLAAANTNFPEVPIKAIASKYSCKEKQAIFTEWNRLKICYLCFLIAVFCKENKVFYEK